jgi:O-6-methylguanine DNA methyltransferase
MIYFTMTLKWGKILIRITERDTISGIWFWNQKYFPKLPEEVVIFEYQTKDNGWKLFNDKKIAYEQQITHEQWSSCEQLSSKAKLNTDQNLSFANLEDYGLSEATCRLIGRIINQFREYEEGTRVQFKLPLELVGTDFQRLVWNILQTIPLGETMTYGQISHRVAEVLEKDKMSAQAIGGAVGRNPISIVIPCHRVIGSQGELTGYAGGIVIKETLLLHEGAIDK